MFGVLSCMSLALMLYKLGVKKRKIWEDLDNCVSKLLGEERVYRGEDLKDHVCEDNAGNEWNLGKHGKQK